MKTKIKIVLLALLSVILLPSCATSLRVAYQTPSEIDMGQYRNIAIASTVEYKGFQDPPLFVRAVDPTARKNTWIYSTYSSNIVRDVALHATKMLESSLEETRFFNITPSSVTDAYISASFIGVDAQAQLQKDGIDVVIIPKLVSMTANESVSSEKYFEPDVTKAPVNGVYPQVEKVRYFLTQTAELTYSYTIIDTATMTVYATKNFSDSRSTMNIVDEYGFGYGYDMDDLFYDMINEIVPKIKTQLVPSTRASYFDLMDNKPKNSNAEAALKAVDNGNLAEARDLYLNAWNIDKHIPSGYNAAIIYASLGDINAGVNLLREMTSFTNDSTVASTLRQLQTINSKNTEAKNQNAGGRVNTSDNKIDINIFQVIMGN